MKQQDKISKDSSAYNGIAVIYLVTIVLAFVIIIPTEEVWYFGVLKAFVWPFYMVTKII